MADRYLKQVLVVRKDLSMPTGKLAAMVAHAAMTFMVKRLRVVDTTNKVRVPAGGVFSNDEWQWLTELDPGLEEIGQVSFAKIVCAVQNEEELTKVWQDAMAAGLNVETVFDSGHSHNKLGDFACIAIGPAWPEELEPVTGGLKVYR